ncbi:histone-fold-containing protein [Chytridium lagenaria]|nr:histone-fold-containing protein [Chytridium lagenaria]
MSQMMPQPPIGPEQDENRERLIAEIMQAFWQQQMTEIENGPLDWKFHQLPLARIKKVMKSDEDVKGMMISAEAPMMFSKACEIFILELTMRAWVFTEESKRRTLQKCDVGAAVSKADMYDFLIDIIPREEYMPMFRFKQPAQEPQIAGFANASQFINNYLPQEAANPSFLSQMPGYANIRPPVASGEGGDPGLSPQSQQHLQPQQQSQQQQGQHQGPNSASSIAMPQEGAAA